MKQKKKMETKIKRITIRLTEDEHALVLQNSKKIGQKMLSQYARNCLLKHKIQVETTDISAQNFTDRVSFYTTQLKKIGQNFNQIVRYLQAKHSPDETKKLLFDAKSELEKVTENSEYVVQVAKKIEQYYTKKQQK
jgi:hypothetical protein